MLSLLLNTTLNGQFLPAVKFEPFTETPPNIEFKIAEIPNGFMVASSDGSASFALRIKPIIQKEWSKPLHGDYWVREIRWDDPSSRAYGNNHGALIWYKGQLWPFIPDSQATSREIRGLSRNGEFVEARSWYDPSAGKYLYATHFFNSPSYSPDSNRSIPNTRAYPVTEYGNVYGAGMNPYSDDTVRDFTDGDILIANQANLMGEVPDGLIISDRTGSIHSIGTPWLWKQSSSGLFSKSKKVDLSSNSGAFRLGPKPEIYLSSPPSCFGNDGIGFWSLHISKVEYDLYDLANKANIPLEWTPFGFKDGKIILGVRPEGAYDGHIIKGYLSIEGVTPGFKPDRR